MSFIIQESWEIFSHSHNNMETFNTLFPIDLYHSYVVEGERDTTTILLRELLESRGITEKDSPDMLCQTYDIFTISDNSLIQEWHSKKPLGENKKVCILATRFINREAEQALLKILEEPKENTHFFIIIPDANVLQDTIRSRVHIVHAHRDTKSQSSKDAKAFLASTPKNRIELVSEIIERNKDNENSGNIRFEAIELVNELEKLIYVKFKNDINNKDIQFSLSELQKARTFLGTPGASVKMILEHMALVI
jgi:DNA polymerase III delta prime subunit